MKHMLPQNMQRIWITLIAMLVCFAIGMGISAQKYKDPSFHTVLFTTVVSADKASSVADKEVASQGLSETIIGWTYSPHFTEKSGIRVAAKKQERQNIVLEFDTPTPEKAKEQADTVRAVLHSKLFEYNELSHTHFALLFEDAVITQNAPKKSMWGIAGLIFGLFFGAFLSEAIIRRKQ